MQDEHGLPLPMVPGNAATPTSLCAIEVGLGLLVHILKRCHEGQGLGTECARLPLPAAACLRSSISPAHHLSIRPHALLFALAGCA